jgi:hypothetical protein
MKALGMDVPKNLQQIADKTKQANTATTDWMGSLSKVAATMGIAFSVGAITNFIGSVFDAASAVKDLSDQWGVSTKAVQQWTGAAKASGVETEAVGKSVQHLTKELGEGSDAYKALLANVGLSYAELRKMPLEDAYQEVIKAIGGIKDETLQLEIAEGLLGASAKKMVGAIRDGFLEAAAAQQVMSDETIKRLEAAQAQWEKFTHAVVVYSGEMLGAVAASTKGMTSSWGNFFTTIGAAARDYFTGSSTAAGLAANLGALDDYDAALKRNHKDIVLGVDDQKDLGKALKTTAQVQEEVRLKAEALKKAQADQAKAAKDASDAQEKYNKSLDDAADTFSGRGLVDKAFLYVEALKQSIPVEQMTQAQQDAINKVMWAAIEVYEAAGETVPKALYDIWLATEKNHEAIGGFTRDLGNFEQATHIDLGKNLTLDPIPMQNQLDKLKGEMDKALREMGDTPKVGMFDGLASGLGAAISGSVLKAIQGGGNVLQSAGSAIGNFLLDPKQSGVGKAIESAASKLPSFLGGAISAAIPAVGAFIGPAVSWLAGKITSWFGEKEYEKIRKQFIEASGGIEELRTAAAAANVPLEALFAARKTDQIKTAIADIEQGFRNQAEAAEAAKKAADDAFAFQADAMQLAIDTAEKYGFTLEELGPAMQRQELDKQAQQLYKDWEVLNSAGIDTVAITDKMSKSVSEYVQHASKMGTEIPSAMRPMLEAMAKSGKLLDENGDAITDLDDDGLHFSMTMSEGFEKLIDKVAELTDSISRSLGLAIRDVPDVHVKAKVFYDFDPVPEAPTSHPQSGPDVPEFAEGTGGFRNFGKGTPVILHGWEAVVPRDDAGAFATVSGGGGAPGGAAMPAIVINAQGAFFDTPESLQRLANKVSDALTAKYSVMGKLRAAV